MVSGSSKHSLWVIILLALLGMAILLFIGMMINYMRTPSSSPTTSVITLIPSLTTSPSLTPSSTSTITLTPRPTWTLKPSSTSSNTATQTPTRTSTLIATITAAKAGRTNMFYELKPWDLVQQERTIELMKANTILEDTDESYSTLAYAEGEAFLRFPDAINAMEWRWDRAFNLVRVGDPQAMPLYATLMQEAISSGQVQASDLPEWFSQYENRLSLSLTSLPPQPGELGRGIIELVGVGSAYFWLVETPNRVNVYPLVNDIDYQQPHENSFLYDDLTGDAKPEVVVYRNTSQGNTMQLLPRFFDISNQPPTELPVQDQLPINFGLEPRAEAEIVTNETTAKQLKFTNLLLPACATYVDQTYRWNGSLFSVSPRKFELVPVSGSETYCEIVVDTASSLWGPAAAISVTLPLLDFWPPATDLQDRPYPPDAYDELRYRLGILYALDGQPDEAKSYLSEIVNSPTSSESSWITPARQFLDVYQLPEDLFTACQQAQYCNLQDAMRTMVKTSGVTDLVQIVSFLKENGIAIRSSASFDFDLDGQPERYMIIQPKPGSKLEAWIISEISSGLQAVFVQVLEGTESQPYYHEPAGTVPVVQLELQKGFVFKRLIDTLEAYIDWVDVEYARPTIILDGYNQALASLMNGSDPKQIQTDLLELLNSPRFKGDCIAFNICDQFHYTLGFVYNLNGEDGNAIDQYMWVWRNYTASPYTTLARLKLDYFPLPTYTPTRPVSSTPTRTRTPTPKTPTATPTETPTVTITPTSTVTPTETGTPTVTSTPTETQTSTVGP